MRIRIFRCSHPGMLCRWKRYAAPLSVETTALFYNTDLVSEVPKTWEELVDQAAADGGVQFDATSIYYDLGL